MPTAARETDAIDQEPEAIPWADVLLSLGAQAATELAKLVVPHAATVVKRWRKCGEAEDLCRAGLLQLKAGNTDEAKKSFTAAAEKVRRLPKPAPTDEASAWWALALTQEFTGDFAGAWTSVKKAAELDPTESMYVQETASIRNEQASARRLYSQGLEQQQ